jgi:hypothetical protein
MLFKGDQIEIERVRRRVDVLFFQMAVLPHACCFSKLHKKPNYYSSNLGTVRTGLLRRRMRGRKPPQVPHHH